MSKFKRFWLWLNREPKDLDKAIKTHKHDASWRFSVGLLGLVCSAIVVLGAAPILQDAKLSGLYSNIEYLSLVSGFCCVMLLFSVLGLLFWVLSLQSENRALHYRLRKLEKRFEGGETWKDC